MSAVLAWGIVLAIAAFAFENYPLETTAVVVCIAVPIFLLFWFSDGWTQWRKDRALAIAREQEETKQRFDTQTAERERLADLRDTPPKPTRAEFESRVLNCLRWEGPPLHPDYLMQVVNVMGEIFEKEYTPPLQAPSAWADPVLALENCFAHGLELAAAACPHLTVQKGYEKPRGMVVSEPVSESMEAIGKIVSTTYYHWNFVKTPVNEILSSVMPNYSSMNSRAGLFLPAEPNYQGLDYRQARDAKRDYERALDRYQRAEGAIDKRLSDVQRICDWTPFFHYAEKLVPNFVIHKPFHISQTDRFSHQFVVGNSGAGKTNYLSGQIAEDLLRASRGECAVFIMDSKNKLIPDIAKLDVFSDDGPLGNRLTYIEPNPEYPISLNIFEAPASSGLKEARQAQQSALQLISFFLDSILQMDATGHQDTILRYAIPAVLAVPNASLLTLHRLLSDGGYTELEPHFRHLRQAEWLKENLGSRSNFNVSRNAVRGRIEAILADDTFYDFFCKPESTIDLSNELNRPRVVLINTLKGELPLTAGPLGRFFIAKLLQFTEQRTLQTGEKLPVFVYIDEASDYLAQNAAVIELLNKAREQRVSFTFAIQGVEDVSTEVLAALRRANIQVFNGTGEIGKTFDIAMNSQPAVTVTIPETNFAKMPRISKEAFDDLRLRMWKAFTPARTVQQPAKATATRPTPTKLAEDDFPTGPSTSY